MTLDHSALWSMYASLEELRGKIGHVLKCAIQMSKVAWSNVIAKRCQRPSSGAWRRRSSHEVWRVRGRGRAGCAPVYEAPQKRNGEAAEAQKEELQRLAMVLTHATSLFGLLHSIASTISHGGSPE